MKSSFQKLVTALFVLMAATSLNAQSLDPAALPTSLAATMKRMSSDLKKVAAQVNDATKNAESEVLANDYVAMALHSKNFTPDKVAALPSEAQKAAKADYDATMDKTAENGKILAQAFHDNDNAKAVTALNALSSDKKDGHARFK